MACTDFATEADFIVAFPALYAEADQSILDRCFMCLECEFRVDKWGCDLFEGSLAFVAHCIKMAHAATQSVTPGSVGGTISGMSQGPVSVSFSVPQGAAQDGWLSQTTEGQHYMSLRAGVATACGATPSAGGPCFVF